MIMNPRTSSDPTGESLYMRAHLSHLYACIESQPLVLTGPMAGQLLAAKISTNI